MTGADLKRLNKQLRKIQDPFGKGLPTLRRILKITADQQMTSISDIIWQYLAWKGKK